MKKRLLITSIVMMLVVAVALSTATYAWFTSNASVSASSISLTAATNTADALGIGWAGGEAASYIEYDLNGILEPMAPQELTPDTTSAAGTASTVTFRTATTREEASQVVFNDDVDTTTNQKLFGNGSVSAFYVKNLSPSNPISKVRVTAVFGEYAKTSDVAIDENKTYYTRSGDYGAYTYTEVETPVVGNIGTYYESTSSGANDMIRVAIFTKDASSGAGAGNYTLLGVLGQTATTGTSVATGSFNKNTTYFTRSGEEGSYVYAQDKTVTAENFESKKATLYTCENTAAYGAASLFAEGAAVKDLDYYAAVKPSLDIVTTRTEGTYTLLAGYQIDIVAVVWLDGTELNDSRAGDIGSVSLLFAAV